MTPDDLLMLALAIEAPEGPVTHDAGKYLAWMNARAEKAIAGQAMASPEEGRRWLAADPLLRGLLAAETAAFWQEQCPDLTSEDGEPA